MGIRGARGFTLIELMVTVVVVAVLLALAVPNFRTMLLNRRQASVADGLLNSLNYARNTALSTDQPVTICPLGTGAACGTSWSNGWIVGTQPASGASVILNTTALSTGGPTLKTAGGSAAVSFNGRGLATGQDVFVICDSRGTSYAQSVQVYATGFIQASPARGGTAPDGTTSISCP
jgi:type IV fimbrial biogenesis protein FimT